MQSPYVWRKQPYLHLKVVDGRVQTRGELPFAVGHRIDDGASSAQDGVHSSWNWDGTSLEVTNCRFGFYPLFYLCAPGEFCISSSLVQLLECVGPQEFDDDAIAVFLRVGYFLEDDTPFRNIKVVPPAADWRWTKDGLVRSHRAYPMSTSCAASRSGRLDDYLSLFRQAMKRRPPIGNVVLPLSGGRDSRHMLFELVCSGSIAVAESVQCVSSGAQSLLEDARVARALCHALGLPHRVIAQGRSFVRDAMRKNLATSFCADEHTWAMPMCDWVNQAKVTLYDGLGGEVLSAGHFSSTERLRALRARRTEQFIADLFGHHETELERWLQPAALVRFSRERAIERATKAAAPHCDKANPVASFVTSNRTRREIALYCCCMYRSDTLLYLPYFDHAFFDYMMSIPGEDLVDKRFHTDAISRGYPQWAHIPYALNASDPAAARPAPFSRRRWNTRLAVALAVHLLRRRDAWVNRFEVIRRLSTLVGAEDPLRTAYWFNTERIIWATQLQRHATRQR
jgi:asparagine synthase (glutamine-hydrolysing)